MPLFRNEQGYGWSKHAQLFISKISAKETVREWSEGYKSIQRNLQLSQKHPSRISSPHLVTMKLTYLDMSPISQTTQETLAGNTYHFEDSESVSLSDCSMLETRRSTGEELSVVASVSDVSSAVVPRHQYSVELSTSPSTFTREESRARKGRYLFNLAHGLMI